MLLRIISLCLATITILVPAQAKTTQTTVYSYFKVHGQSALEIYASLIRHAKGPSGHDAYATTSTRMYPTADYADGKSCSMKNYSLSVAFKINLPHLQQDRLKLSPALNEWNAFAIMLKHHEEHHRSLWISCADRVAAKIQALQGNDCSNISNKYRQIWNDMEKSCRAENDAFDKDEQEHFLRQPFMRLLTKKS
jgi:predicted secreted Zn-dependent protease